MAKPSQLPYLAGLLGQQGAVALANVLPVISVDVDGNPVNGATNAPALLILDELQSQPNYQETILLDTGVIPSVVVVRRMVFDVVTLTYNVSYTDVNGVSYAPVGTLLPQDIDKDYTSVKYEYTALVAATGFSFGDVVVNVLFYNAASFIPLGGFWYNANTGLMIASPAIGNLEPFGGINANKSLTTKVRSLATTNNTLVKAGNTFLNCISLSNTTNQTRWLKIYNKATAPIAGVDVPVMVISLTQSADRFMDFPVPVRLNLGFGYAITQNNADLDATAISAGAIIGNINYL